MNTRVDCERKIVCVCVCLSLRVSVSACVLYSSLQASLCMFRKRQERGGGWGMEREGDVLISYLLPTPCYLQKR